MWFKVRFTGNSSPVDYTEARFEIKDGVLAIHYDDNAKWSEYFAPHAWHQVTAEPTSADVWFLET